MANISSAYGTLALVGDWPEETIALVNQVGKSWVFHGEYGLSMWDDFSFEQEEIEFSGTGRWSFADTLEHLDAWTRDWIRNPAPNTDHPLEEETYTALLRAMAEEDLQLAVSFRDREPGTGSDVSVAGALQSDGERLTFVVHAEEEPGWTDEQLQSAVSLFSTYLSAPALPFRDVRIFAPAFDALTDWIQDHLSPTFYTEEWLEDLFTSEYLTQELLEEFEAAFSPDAPEWASLLELAELF